MCVHHVVIHWHRIYCAKLNTRKCAMLGSHSLCIYVCALDIATKMWIVALLSFLILRILKIAASFSFCFAFFLQVCVWAPAFSFNVFSRSFASFFCSFLCHSFHTIKGSERKFSSTYFHIRFSFCYNRYDNYMRDIIDWECAVHTYTHIYSRDFIQSLRYAYYLISHSSIVVVIVIVAQWSA